MKSWIAVGAIVLALVAPKMSLAQAADPPWFDFEHCSMCKHMGADPEMMSHLQWETHVLKSGMLMTAVIPESVAEKWATVCKSMKAVESELTTGKQLPLCGYCQSYGKLMMAGANIEEIETGFGQVTLVTSNKPEVVKLIQELAKKTQEEYKKMMAAAQ
jgi:hydroxymethylpyrimidine/phosphomethylpyrimidine kinase